MTRYSSKVMWLIYNTYELYHSLMPFGVESKRNVEEKLLI